MYISQDVRVPRSSSAQRRPASTTDLKPRTLIMGIGNLPRLCDTARLVTTTSSLAPSLPTAAEKPRASGIFPTAPTLKPCTGRRSGLNPAAPKPRVSPTRVATPADNYFNGTTTAPGALALSNNPHRATHASGLDPPCHIGSSRERRPPPHSCTPRPPAPDHRATVGLRCGKAGAGTPSPSLALDSAFARMSGGYSGLFPIAEDSASLATPPTPSSTDTGQKPLSGGHSTTARPRPVFKFVWSVCRLSFAFACPRAPPPNFHGTSGTGDPDTATQLRRGLRTKKGPPFLCIY